eukprot:236957-Pyramimonas_sp.AAC.1
MELHWRHHWPRPHASPLPSTAIRGPIGSYTEGPSDRGRMASPAHTSALRGPMRSSSGRDRMRLPLL